MTRMEALRVALKAVRDCLKRNDGFATKHDWEPALRSAFSPKRPAKKGRKS